MQLDAARISYIGLAMTYEPEVCSRKGSGLAADKNAAGLGWLDATNCVQLRAADFCMLFMHSPEAGCKSA